MKSKLVFTIALFMMGLGIASANYLTSPQAVLEEHDSVKYNEVQEQDLPDGVLNSVEEAYPNHEVSKVYEGEDGTYKVVLKDQNENETLALFYNENGEFQKVKQMDKEKTDRETQGQSPYNP